MRQFTIKADRQPASEADNSRLVWISTARRCLSFHPVKDFEKRDFFDEREMWDYVYYHLSGGFRIQ